MTVKHQAIDVFTPTIPARLNFIERNEINDNLVNNLRTPGKQVVVYGHSGSGKTTLLINKLDQLYDNHITSRCTKSTTFEDLLVSAFDDLNPFFNEHRSTTQSNQLSGTLKSTYLGIETQLSGRKQSGKSESHRRLLPAQLSPQNLAKFLGTAKCCWVLEDFHKVEEAEKLKLVQNMKLFMDMADTFPSVKIIAIGAVDTARSVIEYDQEMRNRVAEIEVPLMSDKELRAVIEKGAKLLNLEFREGRRKMSQI